MPPKLRCLHSTPSASKIATSFLSALKARPPLIRTQYLDSNQLQRLGATLPYPVRYVTAQNKTHVPPCHHLVYFTPADVEAELGLDGSDGVFNPPKPFTRRMWAGGDLEWVRDNQLCVGQEVEEKTTVKSVEAKVSKGGEQMLVVGVEKRFGNERGEALVDRRNWVFRHEINPTNPLPLPPLPPHVPFPSATHTSDITHTHISLFRFSALTFNAHKIHYNREWCREVEGHRDCVVHGPLNLIHMVDFWRDVMSGTRASHSRDRSNAEAHDDVLVPKRITYRATGPLYVGETYRILMEAGTENVMEVRIVDGFGKVAMLGRIERW
ncbi:hypothetical protein DSL72_007446 [Monilinia vaccinii-corymbosi]|uniref:FAS1-like dehydratase domain-containing protein n=1 Tax=Monilinia vaccinii-corymbosi TaxID=61207 RepID=A0A8A3PMG2_9HELO|nr:hypothetical protein DSL72_007446 [Monilinia vaccinii-corymbosi]